ncbi:MAG TPA: hypothetical protein VFG10_13250 [Saprospiraceae bacterium]|nr:hypothetical protein [Saprospiraceae bacterium]
MEEKQIAYEEETSLKDLVIKFREYTLESIRYWYIPVFFALAVTGYQLNKFYKYHPVYPAMITFSVDEDEGGGSSGLSSVLGQFGFGGVRPTRYNLDKILELSKSRRVVQQTLFNKIEVDGKQDFIANHLLRLYNLNDVNGKASKNTSPFYFTHDSVPAFDRKENEMLLMIYNFVIGPPDQPKKALLHTAYNEDTNIMSISASTEDETLSLELSKRMFESLSNYYINKAIEKQVKTFKIVREKRDSVLAVLKSVEYRLANSKDTRRSLIMRTDQVAELHLQRELVALSAMYAEVLKNTEVADFALRNKTPFIQVIDYPIPPLAPVQLSLLRQLLIGLILGGAIGIVLVVGRKFFKGILAT